MVTTRSMDKAGSNSGQKTKRQAGPKRKTQARQQTQKQDMTFFKAREIVMSSFPNCLTSEKYHVKSSAIHRLKYVGHLEHWVDFQKDVRQIFNSISWRKFQRPLDVKFRSTEGNANALEKEHFIAGNELSTNSRYVQHVLHVMSAIAKEINIGAYFGDWDATNARKASKRGKKRGKGEAQSAESSGAQSAASSKAQSAESSEAQSAASSKAQSAESSEAQSAASSKAQTPESTETDKDMKLQPDFAILGPDFVPRAAGEGKTPFKKHRFLEYVNQAVDGRDDLLRITLGQTARYMQVFDLKFGFMTNYIHTIFLRQELVAGFWRLMYSDAIPHDQKSTIKPVKVSVREAMLFLQVTTSGDETNWRSYNNTPPEKWVEVREPLMKDGKRKRNSSDVGGDRDEVEEEEPI